MPAHVAVIVVPSEFSCEIHLYYQNKHRWDVERGPRNDVSVFLLCALYHLDIRCLE